MQTLNTFMRDVVYNQLIDNKVIRDDLDPGLCRLTWTSIMMFPFMVPPTFWQAHEQEFTADFLEKLYQHNISVLSQGILKPQQEECI